MPQTRIAVLLLLRLVRLKTRCYDLMMRSVSFPTTPAQVRACLSAAENGAVAVERDGVALLVIMPVEEYTRLADLDQRSVGAMESDQTGSASDTSLIAAPEPAGAAQSAEEPSYAPLKPDLDEHARRMSVADDVERLVAALSAERITASPDDVYAAWKRHSDDFAASWLTLYDDDEANRQALLRHLDLKS
ncbi:hypothetical protein [Sphingomonas ginsenosidimutans]|uniref:hypothetical protein n=1 Tax=Sphingomonas ginsenosidimutans TaxID=862134 RepID=UPI0011426C27|nr:hypothetical protein [Sphingomonas ginsenosidimutans]